MSNGSDFLHRSRAWAAFCSLDVGHHIVTQLSEHSIKKQLNAGEVLLSQEDIADGVYLITMGELRAVRYTANGHEIWLSDLVIGDLVGEIALLTGKRRTSTLVASRPTNLLFLPAQNFATVAREHSVFAFAVAQLSAKRLDATSEQLSDLLGMPVLVRLHAELARSAEPDAIDDELLTITSVPTVTLLGQRIHASREATSRALSLLEKRGFVQRGKSRWNIILPKN